MRMLTTTITNDSKESKNDKKISIAPHAAADLPGDHFTHLANVPDLAVHLAGDSFTSSLLCQILW